MATLQEHFREQCNRHVNGQCRVRRCMLRAGWTPGDTETIGTCEEWEAAAALAAKDAEIERLKQHIASLDYIPLRYKDRPPQFVETRRRICQTPDICFEFGDTAPCCGPCDTAAVKALYGKETPDAQ